MDPTVAGLAHPGTIRRAMVVLRVVVMGITVAFAGAATSAASTAGHPPPAPVVYAPAPAVVVYRPPVCVAPPAVRVSFGYGWHRHGCR